MTSQLGRTGIELKLEIYISDKNVKLEDSKDGHNKRVLGFGETPSEKQLLQRRSIKLHGRWKAPDTKPCLHMYSVRRGRGFPAGEFYMGTQLVSFWSIWDG